jgi:hypothetical protein
MQQRKALSRLKKAWVLELKKVWMPRNRKKLKLKRLNKRSQEKFLGLFLLKRQKNTVASVM